jgi:hypothetical protein
MKPFSSRSARRKPVVLGHVRPSIVSMSDWFSMSCPNLTGTLICKRLQNGRHRVVSVEFAPLRQDVGAISIGKKLADNLPFVLSVFILLPKFQSSSFLFPFGD